MIVAPLLATIWRVAPASGVIRRRCACARARARSQARGVVRGMIESYWHVYIVDNDFIAGDIFRVFAQVPARRARTGPPGPAREPGPPVPARAATRTAQAGGW